MIAVADNNIGVYNQRTPPYASVNNPLIKHNPCAAGSCTHFSCESSSQQNETKYAKGTVPRPSIISLLRTINVDCTTGTAVVLGRCTL